MYAVKVVNLLDKEGKCKMLNANKHMHIIYVVFATIIKKTRSKVVRRNKKL